MPTLSAALGVNKGCVECHEKKSPGVVQSYHDSKHSSRGVQCLDCHKPVAGQAIMTRDHQNVALVAKPSPKNCAKCHAPEVKEFAKSSHAAKSWYAVDGAKDFTREELAKNHLLDAKGQPVKAGKANPVATLIGKDASAQSCKVCHAVGKKNLDGSFGDCTKCHLWRTARTTRPTKRSSTWMPPPAP